MDSINGSVNESLKNTDLTQIANILSYFPRTLTTNTIEFLNNYGLNVSTRWTGTIYAFISLGIIFLGIKVAKPLIKYILIVLGIILFAGLIFVPQW